MNIYTGLSLIATAQQTNNNNNLQKITGVVHLLGITTAGHIKNLPIPDFLYAVQIPVISIKKLKRFKYGNKKNRFTAIR